MEFLQTLEAIRADDASVQRLFGGEGSRAPSRRGATDPRYAAQLAEAATFVADLLQGRRRTHQFQEAMTTSDFPLLFGDILDRQVLAAYREAESTWQPIAKRRTVRDFRGVKLWKPLTGLGGVLPEVGQLEEYPEVALAEQDEQILTVKKYGERVGFSWEAQINDDLDQLRDIPIRLGKTARRTESYAATRLYVGTAGPSSTLYTVGHKNKVTTANGAATNNPALTILGLQDALTVMGNMLTEEGEPIVHEAVTLVVPPALEVIANNIINATSLELTQQGGIRDSGSGEIRLLAANWMARRLKVLVNPLIPLVADTNKNTSWFLFGSPDSDREALAMVFLRGFEEPALFIKAPNAQRVGGGDVSALDGDFDLDAITYKVRHVLGSATVDYRATVASNGTGA